MSRDQILNGDAGAEAQANEVLAILNEEMLALSRELVLSPGNSRTRASGQMVAVQEGGAA